MYFVVNFFVSILKENAKKLISEAKNLNLINQIKTKTIYLIKFNHSMNIINKDKKKVAYNRKRGCDVIHSTISVIE